MCRHKAARNEASDLLQKKKKRKRKKQCEEGRKHSNYLVSSCLSKCLFSPSSRSLISTVSIMPWPDQNKNSNRCHAWNQVGVISFWSTLQISHAYRRIHILRFSLHTRIPRICLSLYYLSFHLLLSLQLLLTAHWLISACFPDLTHKVDTKVLFLSLLTRTQAGTGTSYLTLDSGHSSH